MMLQATFSEATFRAIFESAVQGIVAIGNSGRIELANAMAEHQFGYSPGELAGNPVEVLVPERLRQAHEEHRRHYVAAPRTRPMGVGKELTGRKKDGSEFPVEVSLSYAHDASLAIAFITDISVRKRLELERDRFFRLSPDLLCVTTAEGYFKQVNPAFEKCLGFSAEELIGRSYLDFLHPEDRAAEGIISQGLRKRADVPGTHQNRYISKDGSTHWFEWSASAIKDQENSINATARDVTATVLLKREQQQMVVLRRTDEDRLRALTAQLLKAQEEERRRIARELHDGPTQDLALVAVELEFLIKKASSAEQAKDLTVLKERVCAISEELRLLAHQFHPGVLEHAGLVAALEVYCQEVSRHVGIPIGFVAEPDLGTIPVPVAVSLYRIAQEALHNVTKHSSATTATVTLAGVESAEGKRILRLTIIDDGKGFLIEHVRNGSGLGLISIEERAKLMHGILRISSVLGEGTRVEVEVPLPEVRT